MHGTCIKINTFCNNLSLLIVSLSFFLSDAFAFIHIVYVSHQYSVTALLPPQHCGGLELSCSLWPLYLQANTRIVLSYFSSCASKPASTEYMMHFVKIISHGHDVMSYHFCYSVCESNRSFQVLYLISVFK
jgi:hypothetical protein